MKKQLLSLALLGAATSLFALQAEEAYLYKDPRIMGMGGVNVAVGSYSTSLFSNPAGLAKIKKEDGFVVDLLGLGVSASSGIQDFINDVNDAGDSTEDLTAVLQKYDGDNFHAGVNNYTAVSKNSDAFAWSIGILTGVDANFMSHSSGSGNGDLIETTTRGYGGVVLGVAKPYNTKIGRVDIGIGLKYIQQVSYEGTLGVDELVNTNGDTDLVQKFRDEYEKRSSGFGLDLGMNYYPLASSSWHPTVGMSILNIGAMDMDDNYGRQPMTVNLGVAVSPEVKYIDSLVLGADYVDIFGANKLRLYDVDNNDSTGAYTDYDTYDLMKKIRLGAGIGLIDTQFFSTVLNVGLYQGSYTAGIDMAITVVKLNFATYAEEVGISEASTKDRRYMAQLSIGW